MIGSMTTRPASKKIGNPNSSEVSPKANGARFSPKALMSASVSTCAPPESSSILPSMAPSPTRSATLANVDPNPSYMTGTRSPGLIPAARAVSTLTTTSAMKA